MKIQEYGCETMPQSTEFSEEALALLEKLGADSQSVFYKTDGTVCPYRKMSPFEHAVYKLVLPVREPIAKFKACPIPLRVLQIGAHAKEHLEGELVIWHQGEGKDDPLLTLREGSEYSGSYYLLARWAESLEEFSVLVQQAVDINRDKIRAELLAKKSELQSWIDNCDALVAVRLRDGKVEGPSVHWF